VQKVKKSGDNSKTLQKIKRKWAQTG